MTKILSGYNQLYALLAHSNKNQLRIEAEKLLKNLQNILWKKLKISLTLGISSAMEHVTVRCSKKAQEALLQRMLHGKSNLYFYDDIKVLSASQFPTSHLHMLRQYIERHDAVNIEFLVNDIFSDDKLKIQFNVYPYYLGMNY